VTSRPGLIPLMTLLVSLSGIPHTITITMNNNGIAVIALLSPNKENLAASRERVTRPSHRRTDRIIKT